MTKGYWHEDPEKRPGTFDVSHLKVRRLLRVLGLEFTDYVG